MREPSSGTTAMPIIRLDVRHLAVVMSAEALSRKEGHVGAVALSRTGDPATGDSDAKVIRKFGDVPDDLSAL